MYISRYLIRILLLLFFQFEHCGEIIILHLKGRLSHGLAPGASGSLFGPLYPWQNSIFLLTQFSSAFSGSAVAVRAPIGATVGRVDGQVPVRLPRRTGNGSRPGDHAPVRVRRTGRPAPSVRHAADPVAPAHGARQVRDVPAADRHGRHRRFRGRPITGKSNLRNY